MVTIDIELQSFNAAESLHYTATHTYSDVSRKGVNNVSTELAMLKTLMRDSHRVMASFCDSPKSKKAQQSPLTAALS